MTPTAAEHRVVVGFGLGVATIARPAILAAAYSTTRLCHMSGVLTVPLTIAKAAAPLGATAWTPTHP